MRFIAGYVAFLIAFGICDAVWLSTMTAKLYRPVLGDLIVEQVRYWPAALFYFGFPLGVVYFALMPALRDGSASAALINGALIGLLAYATYDLTNYATLRPWTLTITLVDLVYGTVVVGLCTWVAFGIVRRLAGWGFHEGGLQAGLAVAEALGGVRRPWQVRDESGRIPAAPRRELAA